MATPRAALVSLVVAAAVVVLPAGALASGFDPVLKPTVAGMAAAHRALVTSSELGGAWTPGTAFTPSTSAIPCASLEPNQSDLVETGVGGTSFDHGPWLNVTAAARVFATNAQAEASWQHTDRLALVQCYERSLEGEGQTLVSAKWFSFSSAARHSAGFRLVTATTRTPVLGKGPNLVLRVYTDVFVLSNGRTQELVAFSALTSPVNHGFEARIARMIGLRLLGGQAA